MSSSSPSIPWHRRLGARVAAGISLLVAFSLGAVLAATTQTVTTRSHDRAAADLESARTAFYHLVDDRAEFASAQASLVTALPVFRSHMTDARLASDVNELGVLGEEYRRQMKADFCIVADREGRWTAMPGWPAPSNPPPIVRESIKDATEGHPRRSVVEIGDRLFVIVTEPARFGEEVLGTLTAGFELDDKFARRLALETHCDVNLVAGGRLCASSLGGENRAALAQLVSAKDARLQPSASNVVQRIGNGQYVAGTFPLSPSNQATAAGTLILLQDWTTTADFISQSQRRIAEIGLLVFAIALGAGWLFSRRMTEPLADLVSAAGDIAGGNWSRQVAARGGAETTMMAHAFNDMTTSLRHWYEEAKKRDDQFRQAQKMEAIGRLAGGVAHDFNNLLTAIKGYGELLAEAIEEGDQRRDDVDEIVKAADRASELTRQLLTFSRRQVVATRVLALNNVVAGTQQLLRRLIGEDVALTSALPEVWPVHGDVGQIEQVLVNLAVNARDAMPEGGSLRIELSNVVFGDESGTHHATLTPGRYVQLSVADTGCGMDQETAARIFEPFFTTKEVGRGTGLGLAMAYGVVEQAGGAIDVDTAVGRGTIFRLYFPKASDTTPASESDAPPPVSTPLCGSETILLVEDDHHVNALVNRALTRAGYRVIAATDGEHALEVMSTCSDRIHLLLTDVVMPGMNGRQLSERVVSERPDTRVLFMSGYSDDAVLRHGIERANGHFIQKPFSMDDLAQKIRETLG